MGNNKIKVIDVFVPPPYKSYVDENGKKRIVKTNVMSCGILYDSAWQTFLRYSCGNDIVAANTLEKSLEMKAIIKRYADKYKKSLLNTSIVSKLFDKYTAIDSEIKKLNDIEKVKPFCKKGCCDCCSHYFYISMVEYFAIKYQLIASEMFDEVKAKGMEQYIELMRTNKSEFDLLESRNEDIRMFQDHLNLEMFKPCPLLNDSGECSAYISRPIVCRTYGSTGNFQACEKLKKAYEIPFLKVTFSKSLEKHRLSRTLDLGVLMENVAIFNYKGTLRCLRPYPLIYWLYYDEQYNNLYNISIAMDEADFAKSIWG
ncbi:MAG: YkgJ family cysteine cluster protein [Oscillospiraceae bacterium]